jgi:hypothetical protein
MASFNPTTSSEELDATLGQGWVNTIYDAYGKGCSDAEIIKELKITASMFQQFYDTFPLFAEVVNKGRTDSKAWWEGLGRRKIEKANGDLNVPLYLAFMKNKFGWKDKPDDDADKTPTQMKSNDELDLEIAKKFKEIEAIVGHMNPN